MRRRCGRKCMRVSRSPKRMQRGGGSARRHARSISRSISWSPTAGTKPRSASTSPPSRSVAKPWSARTIPRRRSSRGALTLTQGNQDQAGLLLFHPVYRKGSPDGSPAERRSHLEGFAVGMFRIGDLVQAALRGMDRRGMRVRIVDRSARAPQRWLYAEGDGAVAEASATDRQPAKDPSGLEHRVSYDAHGRYWTLSFSPTPRYLAAQRSWQAWGCWPRGPCS